jgi:hypothetical protein
MPSPVPEDAVEDPHRPLLRLTDLEDRKREGLLRGDKETFVRRTEVFWQAKPLPPACRFDADREAWTLRPVPSASRAARRALTYRETYL